MKRMKHGEKIQFRRNGHGWKFGTFLDYIDNGHVKILTDKRMIASVPREDVKEEFDERN